MVKEKFEKEARRYKVEVFNDFWGGWGVISMIKTHTWIKLSKNKRQSFEKRKKNLALTCLTKDSEFLCLSCLLTTGIGWKTGP